MRASTLYLASVLCLLPACAAPVAATAGDTPARPASADEHIAQAERHEREADALERGGVTAADEAVSPQNAAFDQSGSGGVPLLRPRWSSSMDASLRQRQAAARLRTHAAEHRRIAQGLRTVEKRECQGLNQDEIDLGPFFHSEDIEAVEHIDSGARLLGVRIRFRDVPDLTLAWMQRSVACTRARAAALGYPDNELHRSPLMAAGIRTRVERRGAFIEVTVLSDEPKTAQRVADRARGLVAP